MSGAERLGRAAERIGRGVRAVRSRIPGARPESVVLELRGSYPERPERQRIFGLPLPGALAPTDAPLEWLRGLLEGLGRASFVRTVFLDLSGLQAPASTAYSIRRSVDALRRTGKRVVAYAPRLDWSTYYVASAADEIAIPESAEVNLHGFGVSTAYVGEVLRRWGLRLEKVGVGAYKSAFDEWIHGSMSEEQREQLGAILEGVESHLVETVAAARGLDPTQMRAALDSGLPSARAAKDAALVDRLAYRDEVVPERAAKSHEVATLLPPPPPDAPGRRVAILNVDGVLVPGRSRRSPPRVPVSARVAGAETLVRTLRTLQERDDVGALVLSVVSPGGSALASDLVHREVERFGRQKPVVACFGALAASGGYYVAACAKRIVATPLTLTGSIGVFTAKLSAEDLLHKQGARVETVERGRFAFAMSPLRSLREDERELLQGQAADVYDRFVARVAKGRRRTAGEIETLARGRVWAGERARQHGLVDELGDLPVAVARAKELAGLAAAAGVGHAEASSELSFGGLEDMLGAGIFGEVSAMAALAGTPLCLSPVAWLAGLGGPGVALP